MSSNTTHENAAKITLGNIGEEQEEWEVEPLEIPAEAPAEIPAPEPVPAGA